VAQSRLQAAEVLLSPARLVLVAGLPGQYSGQWPGDLCFGFSVDCDGTIRTVFVTSSGYTAPVD